jgi:membrane peptidoglycan carboxypeptidase
MYRGFALSENVVAVRVAQAAGLSNVVRTARRFGITASLQESTNLVLGGYEVTMLEMVGAYGAIANSGVYIRPHAIRRVLDGRDCQNPKDRRTCRVIFDDDRDLQPRRVVETSLANTVIDLMRGTVEYGTGKAAGISQATVVGKTGTTDAGRDLWFIGFLPQRNLLTAVWLGNDEGTTGGSSSLAAEVWAAYMGKVVQ